MKRNENSISSQRLLILLLQVLSQIWRSKWRSVHRCLRTRWKSPSILFCFGLDEAKVGWRKLQSSLQSETDHRARVLKWRREWRMWGSSSRKQTKSLLTTAANQQKICYLWPGDFSSCHVVHNGYVKWLAQKRLEHAPVSILSFRSLLWTEKAGIWIPQKDQCDTCIGFSLKNKSCEAKEGNQKKKKAHGGQQFADDNCRRANSADMAQKQPPAVCISGSSLISTITPSSMAPALTCVTSGQRIMVACWQVSLRLASSTIWIRRELLTHKLQLSSFGVMAVAPKIAIQLCLGIVSMGYKECHLRAAEVPWKRHMQMEVDSVHARIKTKQKNVN